MWSDYRCWRVPSNETEEPRPQGFSYCTRCGAALRATGACADCGPKKRPGSRRVASSVLVGIVILALVIGAAVGWFVANRRQPVRVSVGPTGGVFTLDGGLELVIPQGALASDTRIEIRGFDAEPGSEGGPIFDVSAHAPLEAPISLILPFETSGLDSQATVVWAETYVEGLGGWVPVDGVVDWERGNVTVETDHLSMWRTLWRRIVPVASAPSPVATEAAYVAIGDSYSSGEGTGSFTHDTDINNSNECHRSTNAFPVLVADRLSLADAFLFKPCSGATTANLIDATERGDRHYVDWELEAQAEWLSEATKIVTITVGGNDLGGLEGGMGEVIRKCVLGSCRSRFVGAGGDEISQRVSELRPNLDQAFQAISENAPNAEVFVIAYPRLFPDLSRLSDSDSGTAGSTAVAVFSDACGVFDDEEADWLNDKIDELNETISDVAAVHGFHFVEYQPEVGSSFVGHELCTQNPWIIGVTHVGGLAKLAADNLVYSMHPTAEGHRMLAELVCAEIARSTSYGCDASPTDLTTIPTSLTVTTNPVATTEPASATTLDDLTVDPDIAVSPSTGIGSTLFQGSGDGFTSSGGVLLEFWYPGSSSPEPYSKTASSSGEITFTWRWETGDAYGEYRVRATDLTTGERSPNRYFTIDPPPTTVDPAPAIVIAPGSGDGSTRYQGCGAAFTPDGSVTLKVWYPDGLIETYPLTADSYGRVTFTWVKYSGDPTGVYELQATDDATGEKSLTIDFTMGSSTPSPEILIAPGIGDGLTRYQGCGAAFTPGGSVTLKVWYPGGLIETYPLTADSYGRVTFTWVKYAGDPTGVYELQATDNATGAKTDIVSFEIR